MKNSIRISGTIILSFLILICSCEKKEVPTLTTTEVTDITGTTATSGGTITDEGSGTILAKGVCWSTSTSPTIADSKTFVYGSGIFYSQIDNLNRATVYYVRAYATNRIGTGYGNQISFKTSEVGEPPTISNSTVTDITVNSATFKGEVNANLLLTSVYFEYGKTTNYGNTVYGPYGVSGSNPETVRGYVKYLEEGTTYHYRIKASNSLGTAYGNDITFTTLKPRFGDIVFNPGLDYNTVTDIEGNIYKTIQIGTQIWMAENLKVIKFNDGTPITLNSGYCWYNNDSESYRPNYGSLYSWGTIITGKICPTGWHIPKLEEIEVLFKYLGGDVVAGGKLKEAGPTHWIEPNTGATNSSGFSALPGGYRESNDGKFRGIGTIGQWWSSSTAIRTVTGVNLLGISYMILYYNNGNLYWAPLNAGNDFNSVRCIKN